MSKPRYYRLPPLLTRQYLPAVDADRGMPEPGVPFIAAVAYQYGDDYLRNRFYMAHRYFIAEGGIPL